MTNSNQQGTLTEGTIVLINGEHLGQIIEVINPNSFRVRYWEYGSAGKSEGVFSSAELTIDIDVSPPKE